MTDQFAAMAKSNKPQPPAKPVQHLCFNHSGGKASPVELLHLANLRTRDSKVHEPTRLDFHILKFVTAGRGKHWIDFEEIKLDRGDVIHIKPAQVHWFDAGSNHEALLLLFRPEAVPDPGLLDLLNFHMAGTLHPQPADFRILLEIIQLHESQQSSRGSINADHLAPYCLGLLVTAIGDLLTSIEKPNRRAGSKAAEKLVFQFELLLQAHQTLHRNLAWYVPRLHTTGRTLARACHETKGMSPKKLIDASVALEAKRQLILTPDSIEEIAFSLGFSESTNFVKFFKRVAGQPPEAFRLQSKI
ncbi:helix-turn-helix domain-containing protein [Verrucomicrobiaceae bacterium 227]